MRVLRKVIFWIVIIVAFVKVIYVNDIYLMDISEKIVYYYRTFAVKEYEWESFNPNIEGIYYIGSVDCKYCREYLSNSIEILKEMQEADNDLEIVYLNINMEKDFEDLSFIKFCDEYNIDTIPAIIKIKNSSYNLFSTKNIKKYSRRQDGKFSQ
ncbi:hypothetical protein [Tissierella praeacuta]|uniref:hypothetical protein n=1 Tax=Tissierella praeacuta TaxID=43131 RepID=UPI00333E8FF0